VNAPWEQCKEHGRAEARVWACPTCLVELRAERDRLIAEVARQVEARDAVAAAEYRLIGELCAARAERDRLRDALQAMMRDVVEVGAELAQRKPLRAFDALTEASHIGHRQMARAYEQADEDVRLMAVRLAAAAAKGG
jgi:hypothetical protein